MSSGESKVVSQLRQRVLDLDYKRMDEDARFAANDDMGVVEFIDSMKNRNTKKKTDIDVTLLRKFGQRRQQDIDAMKAEQLDLLMAQFFLTVRKTNGQLYEPDSLLSMFKEKERMDLKTDVLFSTTRSTLEARRKQMKQMGLGNRIRKAEPFTSAEMEKLWESHELGIGK